MDSLVVPYLTNEEIDLPTIKKITCYLIIFWASNLHIQVCTDRASLRIAFPISSKVIVDFNFATGDGDGYDAYANRPVPENSLRNFTIYSYYTF